MTDKQRFKFYFPAWTACCRANGWKISSGRLLFDAANLSEEGRKVFTFARQRAVMENRPETVDDVRHGCHWLALGRDKSSEHLNNKEVDRVVALIQLLTDPLNLDFVMVWQAYQRGEDPGEVKRLHWSIRRAAPEAYARNLSLDKFGSREWEYLTVPQKRHLAMTLANRNAAWRQPVSPKPQVQSPKFLQHQSNGAAPRLHYIKKSEQPQLQKELI